MIGSERRVRAHALARALCAAACAAALLGGCDGGLFGTGGGDDGPAIPDAAAGPPSDLEAVAPDAGDGFAPEQGDAGAESADPDAPGAPQDLTDPNGAVFVNDSPTSDAVAPLLRAANLTARAVRVLAPGSAAGPVVVAAGAVAAPVALDGAVDSLVVTDALALAPLARTAVRLEPGTLTLLLVVPGDDGGTLVAPLVADAAGPEGGVAAVRVIRATAPGAPAAVELRPAGDDPGGAAVRFAPVPDGAGGPVAATDYASVAPGDYALVDGTRDDAPPGTPVAFEAGRAYSLILTGAPPGDVAPVVVVDSDAGAAAGDAR